MDAAEIASDVATATFFFLGSLAIIAGALLALNRFVLGQPLTESWEFNVKCSVRRIHYDDETLYTHQVEIEMKNTSQSRQIPTRVWANPVFPGEDKFISTSTERSADEATYGPPIECGFAIAPNNTFMFGKHRQSHFMHHAVRVYYAYESRRRRLFRPGYHGEPTQKCGSAEVPVNLEDLKFYSSEQSPSAAEEEA